jgi:hypothetical protein
MFTWAVEVEGRVAGFCSDKVVVVIAKLASHPTIFFCFLLLLLLLIFLSLLPSTSSPLYLGIGKGGNTLFYVLMCFTAYMCFVLIRSY